MFPKKVVGFSIINHLFWGTPNFWFNTHELGGWEKVSFGNTLQRFRLQDRFDQICWSSQAKQKQKSHRKKPFLNGSRCCRPGLSMVGLGGGNSNIFGIFIPKTGEDEPILTV